MVKRAEPKKSIKIKQKQNVNVRVHIDQRNVKKNSKKKRSYPLAKREGVSSFNQITGFTPVYIQSGNPYPPMQSVPEIAPIKNPVNQVEVPSFVNPPVTSTTNLPEEVKSSSPKPIKRKKSFFDDTPSNEPEYKIPKLRPKRNAVHFSEAANLFDYPADSEEQSQKKVNITDTPIETPIRVKRIYTKKNPEFWENKRNKKKDK